MTYTIYGLVDPRDRRLRYIGKTTDVARRYDEHQRFGHGHGREMDAWRREVRDAARSTDLIVFGQASEPEATALEQNLISVLRPAGQLLNKVELRDAQA